VNSRPLNKGESLELSKLNSAGIDSVLVYLTDTGLRKSILDATDPLRELLFEARYHNYSQQESGGEKVYKNVTLFLQDKPISLQTSFYRPKTKKGDPRFWPSKLNHYAKGNDILAAFIVKGELYFSNLSEQAQVDLAPLDDTPYSLFLQDIRSNHESSSAELLSQLKDIARTPILADGHGDTSIGRTIEKALGISMNSSKAPDFKGIEIKAKRVTSKTRNGLFAQVPNWTLSRYKSFSEILETFGYYPQSSDIKRLYCTVSTKQPNPQGLILDLREDLEELHELYKANQQSKEVCLWSLKNLHDRLQTKHPETFWVNAKEEVCDNGKVYFQLMDVVHTRRPSNRQFNRLLAVGSITVDHMIKEQGNRAHEKGPQFKIARSDRHELFLGEEKKYILI